LCKLSFPLLVNRSYIVVLVDIGFTVFNEELRGTFGKDVMSLLLLQIVDH
jgi:hypothetical protein